MSLELYMQHSDPPGFIEGVGANQRKLASELKSNYDFIVCGSGSPGSVVERRWRKIPRMSVLLLEPRRQGIRGYRTEPVDDEHWDR
jgi:hypothetical protein